MEIFQQTVLIGTKCQLGGTDISTTLTTQGDILFRDASGLQRLMQVQQIKFYKLILVQMF